MADEAQSIAPIVDNSSVAPAPVDIVVAAVTEAAPTQEVSENTTTSGPVTEVAKTTPEAPKVEATVLGEALEPKESAPVEASKEVSEAPITEGGQSEDPAPPPKYDPFTAPEGLQIDETRVGEFTNLLSELELEGKASHEAVQQFGQKAVEFHLNEVKRVQESTVEGLTKLYQDAWDKQKADWKDQFLNDPEIGGNRFQTTLDSALTFIRTHGGTPEQQKEFRQLMDTSGLGNHPAMIRMLSAAGRAMSEGAPVAAPKPVSTPKSRTQVMYGKS